jgi:hypothetical protein
MSYHNVKSPLIKWPRGAIRELASLGRRDAIICALPSLIPLTVCSAKGPPLNRFACAPLPVATGCTSSTSNLHDEWMIKLQVFFVAHHLCGMADFRRHLRSIRHVRQAREWDIVLIPADTSLPHPRSRSGAPSRLSALRPMLQCSQLCLSRLDKHHCTHLRIIGGLFRLRFVDHEIVRTAR